MKNMNCQPKIKNVDKMYWK